MLYELEKMCITLCAKVCGDIVSRLYQKKIEEGQSWLYDDVGEDVGACIASCIEKCREKVET